MRMRFARAGSIALVVGLVLSGGAALAGGASPAVSVKFKSGPEAPFGGTRFDGAVFDGKVYFLGFRLADNTTDVSALRISGDERIASTPYAPRMPSPSSNTITSGSPCDISVSRARVIAGRQSGPDAP